MSITNGMLAQMRGDANKILFPDTCTIKTHPATAATVTNDGASDDSDAAWSHTDNVPCRVATVGGNTSVVGFKRVAEADKIVSFPYGTAVNAFDRIVYAARKYEVIEVSDPRSRALSVRVLVKAVK